MEPPPKPRRGGVLAGNHPQARGLGRPAIRRRGRSRAGPAGCLVPAAPQGPGRRQERARRSREMEMRRHARSTPRAERLILAAYWAVSGYGLRATRAFIALALLIAALRQYSS